MKILSNISRFFLSLIALFLPSCKDNTRVVPEKGINSIYELKSLFYVDKSLEAIVLGVDFKDDSTFQNAIANFRAERYKDGYQKIKDAVRLYESDQFKFFALAFAQQKLGYIEDAKATLTALLKHPQAESRTLLWTWSALRKLGKQPPPEIADQVLGVIIEVPISNSIDVLAAYADKRARYLNHAGGGVYWERIDDKKIGELIEKLIKTSQIKLSELRAKEIKPAPGNRDDIVSLLTPDGTFTFAYSREIDSIISPILSAGTTLLVGLLEEHQKNLKSEEVRK